MTLGETVRSHLIENGLPSGLVGRLIDIDGAFNFRDVGGIAAAGGKQLAGGRLYRSAALDSLTESGLGALVELGIRTVVDLRSTIEIETNGRFPHEETGIAWYHVDSGFGPPSGKKADGSRRRKAIDADPMSMLFGRMVDRSGPMFAELLGLVADPKNLPLVFHCTSGKDRTGLGALFTQLVAGVKVEDALADFELTNHFADTIEADLRVRFPGMAKMEGHQLRRISVCDRQWVIDAFDGRGGLAKVTEWLDGIGINEPMRHAIRENLT